MPTSGIDEAVGLMNESDHGSAASLFTGHSVKAKKFRHRAEAENLTVTARIAARMAFFHFGVQKDSFFGDLHA